MQEVSPYDVPVFRIGKRMPLKRLMVKYAENYGFRLSKLEFYNSKGMKLETYDTANLLGDGDALEVCMPARIVDCLNGILTILA